MRLARLLIALFVLLSLSACLSMKSYPDSQYHKATYATVGTFAASKPVRLTVVFQRNGKDFPRAIKEVRPIVERVLKSSGAFSVVTDASAAELRVTLNNVADMGEAAKKGFVTGLTFGGKGSTITDFYEAKIELVAADGTVAKEYKHALITTVGNADAPMAGAAPVTPIVGFGMIVEDIMLNFIQDMKTDGKISQLNVVFAPVLARL